jgi:2,5-diketo-D-gluconate reductase B
MPIRHLGGDPMPAIGLGTWTLSGEQGADVVADALELGYRHIDTAQMYDNEATVGNGMASSGVARHEIFLTTKIDDDQHAPDALHRSLDQSLKRLRTDHVDLLLIHWPVEWHLMADTLGALAQTKADGRARHIGVSNFEPDQVAFALEHAPIEVNQVEYHPLLAQTALLDQATACGLLITAYCPIARNLVATDPAVVEVARRHNATPAQVSLAWLVAQPLVTAIPQTSRSHRLAENLAAGELTLSADDIALIDATTKDQRIVSPPKAPWRHS